MKRSPGTGSSSLDDDADAVADAVADAGGVVFIVFLFFVVERVVKNKRGESPPSEIDPTKKRPTTSLASQLCPGVGFVFFFNRILQLFEHSLSVLLF